jgi:hypothetical protein
MGSVIKKVPKVNGYIDINALRSKQKYGTVFWPVVMPHLSEVTLICETASEFPRLRETCL